MNGDKNDAQRLPMHDRTVAPGASDAAGDSLQRADRPANMSSDDTAMLADLIRAECSELKKMLYELQRQVYEQEEFNKAIRLMIPFMERMEVPGVRESNRPVERPAFGVDLTAFLEEANRRSFAVDEVRQWLQVQYPDVIVEEVGSGLGGWALLRIVHGDAALIVPAIRRPMAGVPLSEYFVVTNYDGREPLKPQNVVRFPLQKRDGDAWTTTAKGELNGAIA